MKNHIPYYMLVLMSSLSFSQQDSSDLKLTSEYASDNEEINDILQFEGIQYYKLKFSGKELNTKNYHLTVKEIWDGKTVSDTTIIDSKNLPFKKLRTINDSILKLK